MLSVCPLSRIVLLLLFPVAVISSGLVLGDADVELEVMMEGGGVRREAVGRAGEGRWMEGMECWRGGGGGW